MGNGALTRRAVFLDRDGVINEAVVRGGKPFPPAAVGEVRIPADVPSALARLHGAGFSLIVVTNQPDVARGTQTRANIAAIHSHLQSTLPISAIYSCFHDEADRCSCRKPLPGLIVTSARDHHIDLPRSFLIGDRWRDIDAGWAAGVTPLLIDYGYIERPPTRPPVAAFASLKVAADWILNRPV